jgi:hypothetical protein
LEKESAWLAVREMDMHREMGQAEMIFGNIR